MADQIAVVTFTTPASPSTVQVTDPSITETVHAAIFMAGNSATDGSATDHGTTLIGFWSEDDLGPLYAGTPKSDNSYAGHGATTSTQALSLKTGGFIQVNSFSASGTPPSGAVTRIHILAIQAISGGIELVFDSVTAPTLKMTVVLFAGLDRAWNDVITVTTTPTQEDCSATPNRFQPDLLIMSGGDGSYGSLGDDFQGNLGFATSSARLGSSMTIDRGTDPTDSDGRVADAEVPFMQGLGTGGNYRGATFTFNSNGFTHQLSTGTSFARVSYLALKFTGNVSLALGSLPIGTGSSQSFDIGIRPDLVLGVSSLMTTKNSSIDGATASTVGFFVFTSSAARAYSAGHQEGVAITPSVPSVSQSYQGDYALATIDHTGAVAQQATLSSMDASGFTLAFSTATAGYMSVLGIQLEQTPFVADTESVLISDGAVLLLSETLIGDTEAVAIADSGVLLDVDVAITGPDAVNKRRGHSTQGGALKGKTWGGGPERGLTA